jgi:hypothetical protein
VLVALLNDQMVDWVPKNIYFNHACKMYDIERTALDYGIVDVDCLDIKIML